MPELPEVETVCRGLIKPLKNKPLKEIVFRRKDLRFPLPIALTTLKNPLVEDISRRAKYILMTVKGGKTIIAHLGMSGAFIVYDTPPKTYDKHDHVIFRRKDGVEIAFRDPRRFGFMLLVDTKMVKDHPSLKELGPEPLPKTFTGKALAEKLKKAKRPIKIALLDQRVVAGVGNIYASEALFLAKISPFIMANTLTPQNYDNLAGAIQKVLNKSIKAGGSSLKDHRQVSGELGYFQHQFQVYGKDKKPCPVCKTAIVKKTVSGRSTFFCPQCQK